MTVRTPSRRSLAMVALLAVLLAGCYRGEVVTTVAEDGSGELVISLFIGPELQEFAEAEEGGFDFAEWDATFPDDAVLSDVVDGDHIGRQAVMAFSSLEELQALTASQLVAPDGAEPVDGQFTSFDVTRTGSIFAFDAVYPEYPDEDLEGLDPTAVPSVVVAVSLPGVIVEHDADEVDGNQMTWRFPTTGPRTMMARSQTELIAGLVDVAGTTHAEAIAWVAAAEITSGYPDDTFRPGEPVTRGQMAAFLERGLSLPAGSATFDDAVGTTHEAAIAAVAAAGITSGYADGTFRPGEPVTRGQMAAFLERGLSLPAGSATFADVVGTTHEAAIAAVAAAGITSGYADGTFRPGEPVTRGQMAAFLFRALADEA